MAVFDTRIRHKRDTSANWTTNDPVLLNGELIIVDTADGRTRTKTGDGTKTYTQLPFNDEVIYAELAKKGDSSIIAEATLLASAWVDGQQTVTIEGLTTDQNGIASLPHDHTSAEYEAASAAALTVTEQNAGSITFKANGEVPQIDITISVMLLG